MDSSPPIRDVRAVCQKSNAIPLDKGIDQYLRTGNWIRRPPLADSTLTRLTLRDLNLLTGFTSHGTVDESLRRFRRSTAQPTDRASPQAGILRHLPGVESLARQLPWTRQVRYSPSSERD